MPDATVTVTQDGKTITTVTDEQGLYAFPDLTDGAWEIEIRMQGFAPLTGEVTGCAECAARQVRTDPARTGSDAGADEGHDSRGSAESATGQSRAGKAEA